MKSTTVHIHPLLRRSRAALQKCRRLLPAMLLLPLSACLPQPIDIQVDPAEPEIVIASQIIPDRIMVVAVTRSFSALELNVENGDSVTSDFLSDLLVDRARVEVSYAGVKETLVSVAPGIYASISTLQFPNEMYALSVYDSATGESVTAQTTMLPYVGFDTLYPVVKRSATDSTVELQYTFTDPPGDNWYVVNVIKQGDSTTAGFDINSFFSLGLNVITETHLISDKTYSGSQITERLPLYQVGPSDSIVVTISNISHSYYDYLQAQERAQGILSSITQEPINRPTNVQGGRGFFNAYFPEIRYFDLKEW